MSSCSLLIVDATDEGAPARPIDVNHRDLFLEGSSEKESLPKRQRRGRHVKVDAGPNDDAITKGFKIATGKRVIRDMLNQRRY